MTDKINPYSQHFRCMARLLKNSSQNDIFMYLLDEHMMQTRKGIDNPCIEYNQKRIAEESGINRCSVESNISKLEDLGLIHVQDKLIFIDVSRLISIVSLFNAKETHADKQSVCKAFRANDNQALLSLGWQEEFDGKQTFQELEGAIVLENQQQCWDSDTSCVGNPTTVLEIQHILEPFFNKFPKKTDFLCWISSTFSDKNVQIQAIELADTIYLHKNSEDPLKIAENCRKTLDFLLLGVCWISSNCVGFPAQGVLDFQHSSEKKCWNSSNRNKEYNKEKINIEPKALFERDESDERGFNEVDELSEKEENFFKQDLTKVEVVDLKGPEEPIFRKPSVIPYFNSEEIDAILNDVDKAKQRPFWLFLYNFWGEASVYTPLDDEEEDSELDDDSGIEEHSAFNDPEGKPLFLQDFETCKKEAYRRTLSEIENGKLEDCDEEVELNAEEMFSADMMSRIFDWEPVGLNRKESCVVVVKSRIRNIEADRLASVEHPASREERRAAVREGKEVMVKLHKAKASAGLYSSLTRIERMLADFIDEYYKPNPDKEDSAPFVFKGPDILPREEWRRVQVRLKELQLTPDDFFEACIDKDGPSEERLPLKRVMFYADGIRFVNAKYREKSTLDEIAAG